MRSGNRPVVILGATGRLGQMVRTCWPERNGLICQSRTVRAGFVTFDLILEPEKAAAVMADAQAVICLSGVTPARAGQQTSLYSRNTTLAMAALKAVQASRNIRVFLSSSAAVYGTADGIQDETAVCEPISDYGRAKLMMEQTVLDHARSIGVPATVLRIGNVAGADAILGGWREGMTIDQLEDGRTPMRSYIGPATLARVLHTLSFADTLPDVLNITSPGAVEMGALLDAAKLPWSPRPAGSGVIPKVELSTNRLEEYLGFSPESRTPEGIVAEWRNFLAQK